MIFDEAVAEEVVEDENECAKTKLHVDDAALVDVLFDEDKDLLELEVVYVAYEDDFEVVVELSGVE